MAASDRAIVVGISRYPGLSPLGGPENDARLFYDWLVDPGGGDVPQDHVKMILSSTFDEVDDPAAAEPTAQEFERAVDELEGLVQAQNGLIGRRLYLYFAGHGFAPDNQSAALLMANATPRRSGHHIAGRLYAEWFATAAYFDEVALFMDCCRGSSERAPLRPCHLPVVTSDRPACTYALFATKYSAAARERLEDDVARGYFTSALVAGLREAVDPSGEISGTTLSSFFAGWYLKNAPQGLELPVVFPDPQRRDVKFRQGVTSSYTVTVTVMNGDERAVTLRAGDANATVFEPSSHEGQRWSWVLPSRGIYKYGFVDGESDFVEIDGSREAIYVQL